jgi:hypothetical protein
VPNGQVCACVCVGGGGECRQYRGPAPRGLPSGYAAPPLQLLPLHNPSPTVARPSPQPKLLLSVIPGYPMLNFVLCTAGERAAAHARRCLLPTRALLSTASGPPAVRRSTARRSTANPPFNRPLPVPCPNPTPNPAPRRPPVYVYISHRLFLLTLALKDVAVPHDNNRLLARNAALLGALGCGAAALGWLARGLAGLWGD